MSKEKIIRSEVVHRAKHFEVRSDIVLRPDGKEIQFTVVDHPGAVVVIPQLEDGRFLLEQQGRRSIGRELLEFPAGTLEPGEDPLLCAKRELIEETNHEASEWIDLGKQYPCPGFCNEMQHCYLARGLKPKQGKLDDDEDITVVAMTKQEFLDYVKADNRVDGKSLAVFLRALVRGLI